MRHFRFSVLFSLLALPAAFAWGQKTVLGGMQALILALFLGIMEVSLSFDNAVVNASVLRHLEEKWRRYFLTWGILIAVFGMRLVLPLLIVALATGLEWTEVVRTALLQPEEYARHVQAAHIPIAAFGGMFLLMVFLAFLFDEGKTLHWLGAVEEKLAAVGKVESIEIVVALLALLSVEVFLPEAEKLGALIAGIWGIVAFVLTDSLSDSFAVSAQVPIRSGILGFLYLQVLDASFSLDGVVGAFAITKDVVVIMLGLGIGAMFVRSLTVFLVHKGTLEQYVFLEHGAFYAIGALALIMLTSMVVKVSEVIAGLVGVSLIVLSLISSIRYKAESI
ncbi:MAG: DUF475 domain-containing protein [Methylohalobius sp.]|nr:DUF475 domain-containing protein [Methylohalobius sp.]